MPCGHVLKRLLLARGAYPVVIASVAMAILVCEWAHHRSDQVSRDSAEFQRAQLGARETLHLLHDAEAAQRAYLITDRAELLRPYDVAVAALPHAIAPTTSYLATTHDGAADMRAARQLAEARMARLALAVDLQRAGDRDRAQAIVQSDASNALEQIGGMLDRALATAHAERHAQPGIRGGDGVMQSSVLHSLALLGVLGLAAGVQRLVIEARHRSLNRGLLERTVLERTEHLRALAVNLQTMLEGERARLSRELHDEIGALLTAVKFDLSRATRSTTAAPVAECLANIARRIDEVAAIKRRIVEDLSPSALVHLGLRRALTVLCREVGERLHIPVQADIRELALRPEAQIAVYRIVQEALTNVQKHAGARRVAVTVSATDRRIEVLVVDDGRGFDLRHRRAGGHGLDGLRCRVEGAGGQFDVRSVIGRGTRVRARLPCGDEPLTTSTALRLSA